ncbi:2038_t:CDS:2, partial [Paraglomus occultum]
MGFLGLWNMYLSTGQAVQPRRISQDMLEGLFGTIREISGDSSTQTVQSYGYAINKSTIMMQMTSEIHSLNYGSADGSVCMLTEGIAGQRHIVTHRARRYLAIMRLNPTFIRRIFQELLNDNL